MRTARLQAASEALVLASLAFRYPDRRFATAAASGEFDEAFGQACEAIGAQRCPCRTCGTDVDDVLHDLRVTYTNLFLSLPHARVSLYESVWPAAEPGSRPLPFANDVARGARELYRSAGLEPAERKEPPDHVAFELEFAARLIDASDLCLARSFLRSHVATWVPKMCGEIRSTSEGFYADAAEAIPKMLSAILNMRELPEEKQDHGLVAAL